MFSFSAVTLFSQGVTVVPVAHRNTGNAEIISSHTTAVISDTLNLPFFENFTAGVGYPSAKRWTDNQVWVNNHFPLGHPDFNVATFDHLDHKGRPYGNLLNKNIFVYADSLTSQPINLQFYKTGPVTTKNYAVSDSIYLSFFFQTQGIGDVPEAEDSLILYFRAKSGMWKPVWWRTVKPAPKFEQAMVLVNSTDFLYENFQFRWVNYTKSTGNLNHWHLDYIRMDKGRSRLDTGIRDVAIRTTTPGLLKNYSSMPYSHFLADKSGQIFADNGVTIRNLNAATTVQTRFQVEVKNRYGSTVLLKPFSLSSRNVLPGDTTEMFGSIALDTLSGPNPYLDIEYKIAPQSDDITPDNYNAEGNNNAYKYRQTFTPWYAWDDGSAEGGFGLNYEFLPDIRGQFAMSFDLTKDDSLRGLGVYFNRSLNDVTFRNFNFRIWKSLSPIGETATKDALIYEHKRSTPAYSDSINHFSYFYFDSSLFLTKGTYYIGWVQYQNFVLNIGYDNNYRYQRQNVKNPNMFYNLLGQWEYTDASVKGVPMIRPLIGSPADHRFNTRKVKTPLIKVFPNPASDFIYWNNNEKVTKATIADMQGRMLMQQDVAVNFIDISALPAGSYLLNLTTQSGKNQQQIIIKN